MSRARPVKTSGSKHVAERWPVIGPRCTAANSFKIDLDEGSSLRGRLDPDGTFALAAADGLGCRALAWTMSPQVLRTVAHALNDAAACLEGHK